LSPEGRRQRLRRAQLAGKSDMQLTPDYTIIIQVAIFIAVWLGLRALIFTPTEHVLAVRHERTVQAHTAAEAMIAAAQADRARYEDALHQRRVLLAQEAAAARQEAAAESDRQIAATRAAIAEELGKQREAVAAQVEVARRSLAADAERIATEMLQRVTGGARA
jgi:F0F1-type ATP synthase membrane subunit b/b'